ncbi:hypothetical protein RQP46_009916 [Phenoliferia psychrophenolica]
MNNHSASGSSSHPAGADLLTQFAMQFGVGQPPAQPSGPGQYDVGVYDKADGGDVDVGPSGEDGEGGEGGEGEGEGGEGQPKKKRKLKSSAPRTSRACLLCRKQKMRCEGADEPPCKRCRASNQECHFERRSDYLLHPQDSAWQTKIESRLTHLTSTVDAILAALQSSGVAVHVPPPPPPIPQSPEQSSVRGGVLAQAVAAVTANASHTGPYHPGIASGAFDDLGVPPQDE